MTDRFHSLTVVLGNDMRDDDAEGLMDAICHLKGVINVKGNISDPSHFVAESRVKSELSLKLWEILKCIP